MKRIRISNIGSVSLFLLFFLPIFLNSFFESFKVSMRNPSNNLHPLHLFMLKIQYFSLEVRLLEGLIENFKIFFILFFFLF